MIKQATKVERSEEEREEDIFKPGTLLEEKGTGNILRCSEENLSKPRRIIGQWQFCPYNKALVGYVAWYKKENFVLFRGKLTITQG